MHKHLLLFVTEIAMVALRCASLNGSGSTTTNGHVIGALCRTDGSPASGVRVTLIPVCYDPQRGPVLPDSCSDTTTAAGGYELHSSLTGLYNIEAVYLGDGTMALICSVSVRQGDTIHIPTDTLKPPGAVKVMASPAWDITNGYVFMQGTTFFSGIGNGAAVIGAVPAGAALVVCYGEKVTFTKQVVREGVRAVSADTVTIRNPGWRFSRCLYMNTTPLGANVSSNVVNFPVLVRLTGSSFVFSQTKAGGADVRFTKSDGTALYYEIERWDSVNGQAEIWVKVDTVYGNDSTHYIVMYWGNAQASEVSNPMAVFDTSASGGFQGVWHLAEAGNTTALDATPNHYNGMPSGMGPASAISGVVGIAQRFDGISSYLQMQGTANGRLNFPERGTYTVSAWVNTDTLDSTYQSVVSKGEYQYSLQLIYYSKWEFFDYINNLQYEATRSDAKAREWTHLTAVRSGAQEYFYVNGTLADSIITVTPNDSARNTNYDVTIGKRADSDSDQRIFKGSIDEVRIQSAACGPDWAKLCYMNQKVDDALIIWK